MTRRAGVTRKIFHVLQQLYQCSYTFWDYVEPTTQVNLRHEEQNRTQEYGFLTVTPKPVLPYWKGPTDREFGKQDICRMISMCDTEPVELAMTSLIAFVLNTDVTSCLFVRCWNFIALTMQDLYLNPLVGECIHFLGHGTILSRGDAKTVSVSQDFQREST